VEGSKRSSENAENRKRNMPYNDGFLIQFPSEEEFGEEGAEVEKEEESEKEPSDEIEEELEDEMIEELEE